MYKNYFYLNREIIELNNLLYGYKLDSIFSQFKDILIICFKKDDNKIHLEISTNPGEPYLVIKENFSRAKKNTVNIFDNFKTSYLLSFKIAENDRIIKIKTEKYSLYYAIRSKYTNVYFIDDERIDEFKKTNEDIVNSFKEEIKAINFISRFRELNFIEEYDDKEISFIRNDYPILSKDIILEYKSRCSFSSDILSSSILKEILNEIKTDNVACYVDAYNSTVRLSTEKCNSYQSYKKETFSSYQEALNFLLSKQRYFAKYSRSKKAIDKYISKEKDFISSKLNNLKILLEKGEQTEKYKNIADILLTNIRKIKKGMSKIILIDFNNENIEIKLDPKANPKQNIDKYYTKSRGEKIRFKKAKEEFEIAQKRFIYLNELENNMRTIKDIKELDSLMKGLKLNKEEKKNTKEDITSKFKTYLIDDKYYVYVGKDGKTNDLLTTKFAKQNDIWFHVRGLPGSHVILRFNEKTNPPKPIIKNTASVAAYHSKAKTAGLVPVSYALKKYVVKKKGMAPGKVLMLKEEIVLVRPEIPKNCVFLSQVN